MHYFANSQQLPADSAKVSALYPLLFVCAVAADPEFLLETVDSRKPFGKLIRLDKVGTIQLAGSAPVGASEFVGLIQKGIPRPSFPTDRPYLLFANGDRLIGSMIEIEKDAVRFQADCDETQEIQIPVSSLTAIFLSERAVRRSLESEGRQMVEGQRRKDVVLLSNGDTKAGVIGAWPKNGPLKLGSDELPRDRVDAVLFSSDLISLQKPRSPYRHVVLRNGTRLSVKSMELEERHCKCVTFFNQTVRFPLESLAVLSSRNGRAVYLSDLPVKKYEHQPFLSGRWPLMNDRSVSGMELRFEGSTFEKGLGMHSRSRVAYAIPPKAKRFESLVGLNEVMGRRGSVKISVDLDGKVAFGPVEIDADRRQNQIVLPISPDTKELSLNVDFGNGGDVQDHVDWADCRFIVDS